MVLGLLGADSGLQGLAALAVPLTRQAHTPSPVSTQVPVPLLPKLHGPSCPPSAQAWGWQRLVWQLV
jgi:hypothetical protein